MNLKTNTQLLLAGLEGKPVERSNLQPSLQPQEVMERRVEGQKRCYECHKGKNWTDYHKDKNRKDGLSVACKECAKAKAKKWYWDNTERSKAASRRWEANNRDRSNLTHRLWHLRNPEWKRKADKKYRTTNDKFPIRSKARRAVRTAISKRFISPATELSCQYCGIKATEYHHHLGYEKKNWLDVIPICRKCHQNIHTPRRQPVSTDKRPQTPRFP